MSPFFFLQLGCRLTSRTQNHEIISLTLRTNEVEEVEVQLFKFIDLHKLQIKLRKLKVEVY